MRAQQIQEQRGSTMIEFVIVACFLYTPLILGVLALGGRLSRGIQAAQITRDAGHMFGEGTDMSQAAAQNLVVRLADGLNMTANGGNGVVILSKITYVGDAQCDAAGLNTSQCTNRNHYVVTLRATIGNASLRPSKYGTPASRLIDSRGNVSDYLADISTRADGFSALMTMNAGEDAYLTESYFSSSDFDVPGFMTGTGIYSSAVF